MNSNHEEHKYTVWLNNGNETEIVAYPDENGKYVGYVVRDEEYCQIDNFFEEGFATVEEALQMAKKALAEEGYIKNIALS